MNRRELYEQLESRVLSENAVLAVHSKGRKKQIQECDVRTCFQRDIDRVTHSKSFRRLMRKTQVFLSPEGDHYRTRLTHTLEVSRIARTIVRALGLNEDLTEAIALAHDLGHTPFGHAGEQALSAVVTGGFKHNEQGIRVVEKLERDGEGLNLSREVLDGILHHTGDVMASTFEGKVIKYADRIAYTNHDIDDAIRAGILNTSDIPKRFGDLLGQSYSAKINTMLRDVITTSSKENTILMSPEIGQALLDLREFMFERVYKNPKAKGEEVKAKDMLRKLYEYYVAHPDSLPSEILHLSELEGLERAACDYIAGMTDHFAVRSFEEIFVPRGWSLIV